MASHGDDHLVGVRRLAVLALIGVLMVSAVGGMLVGSTGIATAQWGGGPNTTPPGGWGDGGSGGGGGSGDAGAWGGGDDSSGGGKATPTGTKSGGSSSGDGKTTSSGTNSGGSSSGGGNDTAGSRTASTSDPVNATIKDYKRKNLGYKKLSPEDKKKFKEILRKIEKTDSEQGRFALINEIEKEIDWPNKKSKQRRQVVRANFGAGTDPSSTPSNPVNTTIKEFKQKNLGYKKLSSKNKEKFRNLLQKLNNTAVRNPNRITKNQQAILSDIGRLFGKGEKYGKRQKVVKQNFGIGTKLRGRGYSAAGPKFPGLDFRISDLLDFKLRSFANSLLQGASAILSDVYKTAFSTPVPQNTGWQGIFGTPTNQPFTNLYQNLLVKKLYPLTNLLLGIGIIFMGLSLTVNPLISRFRAWDLMIKFATFILLYGFSWIAVTLMHGAVNDITMWIAPSAKAVGGLVTNVGKMSGIAIGAYFVGSGGIMATAFSMAIELQMRLVMLKYFFPYVFTPLILVLYVSPWQRLRTAASTALWQYVNVLVLVIPMALFLKAATLVKVGNGLGETLHAMLVLCALFGAAVSMPIFTTWFFFKVPGKAAESVKSAGKSAAKRGGKYAGGKTWSGATSVGGAAKSGGSRVGGAVKDRMGWGGDGESAMDEPDPSDRAEEQVEATVEATDEGDLSLSDSGLLDSSTVESMPEDGYTTAGLVRELDEEQNSDTTPMNHEEMVESYYEESSHQTTLDQQVAD